MTAEGLLSYRFSIVSTNNIRAVKRIVQQLDEIYLFLQSKFRNSFSLREKKTTKSWTRGERLGSVLVANNRSGSLWLTTTHLYGQIVMLTGL